MKSVPVCFVPTTASVAVAARQPAETLPVEAFVQMRKP